MPPKSCLARHAGLVEPAEGRVRGGGLACISISITLSQASVGGGREGGVRPFGIVKDHPPGDEPLGLEAV